MGSEDHEDSEDAKDDETEHVGIVAAGGLGRRL